MSRRRRVIGWTLLTVLWLSIWWGGWLALMLLPPGHSLNAGRRYMGTFHTDTTGLLVLISTFIFVDTVPWPFAWLTAHSTDELHGKLAPWRKWVMLLVLVIGLCDIAL